jgi:hypothetical protein
LEKYSKIVSLKLLLGCLHKKNHQRYKVLYR